MATEEDDYIEDDDVDYDDDDIVLNSRTGSNGSRKDGRRISSKEGRDDDDITQDHESRDGNCCITEPCSSYALREVPSWLCEREEYERELIHYHRNKVKYLRQDIKRQRKLDLDTPPRVTIPSILFACVTCNACGTLDLS